MVLCSPSVYEKADRYAEAAWHQRRKSILGFHFALLRLRFKYPVACTSKDDHAQDHTKSNANVGKANRTRREAIISFKYEGEGGKEEVKYAVYDCSIDAEDSTDRGE